MITSKVVTITFLFFILFFIFSILIYIQKNVLKNQKTIDNLEHFIANEVPSYFKGKKISPNCCPSTYSTDRGCVCLNDQDKNMIYTRGNNSSL